MENLLFWYMHQFDSMGQAGYRIWYAAIEKPFFAPEPWVFGAAWGLIYPLIAIALVWSVYLYLKKRLPRSFLGLFALNIALNLSFSPVLLATRDNALISLVIVLVLGTLAWLMLRAWKLSKVVFVLLIPYLLWGAFATVLQLTITVLN